MSNQIYHPYPAPTCHHTMDQCDPRSQSHSSRLLMVVVGKELVEALASEQELAWALA